MKNTNDKPYVMMVVIDGMDTSKENKNQPLQWKVKMNEVN
jgi:hypothetical protein